MVFDVDKLKKDRQQWRDSWTTLKLDRAVAVYLKRLLDVLDLVVAGQPSLRCMTHNVEVRWPDASNCVAGANNPELCELVKGWWMPTGGGE